MGKVRLSPINKGIYCLAKTAGTVFAGLVFRRKILRNELKTNCPQGAFVVLANHEAALDFVNLIGVTRRRLRFVLSRSFFHTLPIPRILEGMGVIAKQQFQSTPGDLMRMKAVLDRQEPLVLYPAGLMCEDGISTPIPDSTYGFLQWLGVDVYVARTYGSYFVMPKWGRGLRPGRTEMEIYRLFTAEELKAAAEREIREKVCDALEFDAYREQESRRFRYLRGSDLRGLETVLYACPHCGREYTVQVHHRSTLRCSACGYAEQSDRSGFLHRVSDFGPELRYVSDWSRMIQDGIRRQLLEQPELALQEPVEIRMIDYQKHKYVAVGQGILRLNREEFLLTGTIHAEPAELHFATRVFPTLPFVPGKQLELQTSRESYRCVFADGKKAAKFIHMLKAAYELHRQEDCECL